MRELQCSDAASLYSTLRRPSQLLLEFAFPVVKAHRIEARAAVTNARGNAALQKIGARHEGVLRAAFVSGGHYLDQNLCRR